MGVIPCVDSLEVEVAGSAVVVQVPSHPRRQQELAIERCLARDTVQVGGRVGLLEVRGSTTSMGLSSTFFYIDKCEACLCRLLVVWIEPL